jgi:hypothetical protein
LCQQIGSGSAIMGGVMADAADALSWQAWH